MKHRPVNEYLRASVELLQDLLKAIEKPRDFNSPRARRYRKLIGEYRRVLKECQIDDLLRKRERINEIIKRHNCDGVIHIVWEAQDCDHVYTKDVTQIPATFIHYVKWEDDFYHYAEGPQSHWITQPFDRPTRITRDLGLEAFENGHPHLIHA